MRTLDRAKAQLLLDHPFFATLLLKMGIVITDEVPTAAVDGVNLYVNLDWFNQWNQDQQIGLLAHEVLHPAFLHHTRRGDRDPKLWNIACDYAINLILADANIKLPDGGCLDDKYRDMGAEEIYNKLLEQGKKGAGNSWQPGDGFNGGFGDVMDLPGMNSSDPNDPVRQMEEQKQVQALISAHQVAKAAGKGVGGVDRLIKGLLEPKVDWQTELQRLVSEKTYDDYTWAKPNRRHINRGFYLPILENESYGEIALIFDTSASVSQDDLNVYASECNGIGSMVQSKKWVIYCDSGINGEVEEFDHGDDLVLTMKGGGGTDFRPPFVWLDKNSVEPKMAIYFTDGYCYNFPSEPDFPVIWALYGGMSKEKFSPPFGDIIEIPKGMK